eukprot:2751915-Rhodomonas_salina.1
MPLTPRPSNRFQLLSPRPALPALAPPAPEPAPPRSGPATNCASTSRQRQIGCTRLPAAPPDPVANTRFVKCEERSEKDDCIEDPRASRTPLEPGTGR